MLAIKIQIVNIIIY